MRTWPFGHVRMLAIARLAEGPRIAWVGTHSLTCLLAVCSFGARVMRARLGPIRVASQPPLESIVPPTLVGKATYAGHPEEQEGVSKVERTHQECIK